MSLERFALLTAILGVLFLIFLSEKLEPKIMNISEISSKNIDSYVKIRGNITYIKNYESSTLFKVEDSTGKIYAIFYGKINLTKQPVVITGRVTEYKGILEIEADKITSD